MYFALQVLSPVIEKRNFLAVVNKKQRQVFLGRKMTFLTIWDVNKYFFLQK